MAVEELHCDDGVFADWTSTTQEDPSVIEQVPAAAHDGARGNRTVINENSKVAYASRQNWASAMAMGELRAIGHWWKVVSPIPAGPINAAVIATIINSGWAAVLNVNPDNEVSLTTWHDGGYNATGYTPLFTGTEWRHVRLVLVRHATTGGAQLWVGDTLWIDDALYNTTNKYNGVLDWLHAGCASQSPAGFEIYQDEFRIATTLAGARASGGYRLYAGATPGAIDYTTPVAKVVAGVSSATIAGLGLEVDGEVYIAGRAITGAGVEETNTTQICRVVTDGAGVLLGGPPGAVTDAAATAIAGGVVKVELSYVAVSDATVTVQIARVVAGAIDWGSPLATVTVAASGATEATATLATPFSDGETVELAARPITDDGIAGSVFTLAAVVADDAAPPDVSRVTLEAAE